MNHRVVTYNCCCEPEEYTTNNYCKTEAVTILPGLQTVFNALKTSTEWVKPSPLRFSDIFSQTDGNFLINFPHLLYVPFYTRLQIFFQLTPTLTKLRHTKRDHPTNFYVSLEV